MVSDVPRRRRSQIATALICVASIVAGCAGAASSSPAAAPSMSPAVTAAPTVPGAPTATATATATQSSSSYAAYDAGGFDVYLTCEGSGSPTVIVEPGLNGQAFQWQLVADGVAVTTRICVIDRAGLGSSAVRPAGADGKRVATVGSMADEQARVLANAGAAPPYVLVGHSYGGMIQQVFAFRHASDTAGIVLVDSSSAPQFEDDWLANGDEWSEGQTLIDRPASATELRQASTFGATPLVVLTQGQLNGDFEAEWSGMQDALAAESSTALHVVARKSGHLIEADAPNVVVAAVAAVVAAARPGGHPPSCDAALVDAGAECLATTLTDQLEAWGRIRDAVVPTAGPLPSGVYRATLTAAAYEAATGDVAVFATQVNEWTIGGGHWSVSSSNDGGAADTASGVYAATDAELTLVWPLDWKIPRTSGVNRVTWAAAADGTLTFKQVDGELPESVFTVPWQRVAGSG